MVAVLVHSADNLEDTYGQLTVKNRPLTWVPQPLIGTGSGIETEAVLLDVVAVALVAYLDEIVLLRVLVVEHVAKFDVHVPVAVCGAVAELLAALVH